jgi:hypothetical protein
MKLSARAFNRHLNHLGQSFSWRRGYACPCVSRDSGQPNPQCNHCEGKGRLWTDTAVEGTAGVVSQAKLRQYEHFGPFDKDDIMLSIGSDSPLYAMGQFDRMVALQRTEPFSLTLVRGLNDTIRFPILSIDRAMQINAQDELVDLPLPKVKADGTLDWDGSPPPAGLNFSLTGRRRPQYYCYLELPTDRPMHHGEPLPRKLIMRRFDLFGR